MMSCRAALARSKGWAPRPLPPSKLLSTAGVTAADGTATVEPAAAGIGNASSRQPAAAVQPLPWRDPGLRFTSAPMVDDDIMIIPSHAEHAEPDIGASDTADETDITLAQQVRHCECSGNVCAVLEHLRQIQRSDAACIGFLTYSCMI